MTVTYSIFRVDNGLYVKTITAPSEGDIALNTGAGEVSREGDHPGCYLDGENIESLPPRPGSWAVWSGSVWTDPRTDENKKAAAREAIRLRRDQAIVAGATVSGIAMGTDDKTQARIMGAAVSAMLDPDYTVAWKSASGVFITLNAPQVIAFAQAIRAHVQACFDREAALLVDVEAGRPYDLDAGWPA